MGSVNLTGESGETGNTVPGYTGKGGSGAGPDAGEGGDRVGLTSNGNNGSVPGGGGSGAQEGNTPAGGGGGGGYAEGTFTVMPGSSIPVTVDVGGAGGNGDYRIGGDGAAGKVEISWSVGF